MVSLPDLLTIHRLSVFGKSRVKAPRRSLRSLCSAASFSPCCPAARIALCLPASLPFSCGIRLRLSCFRTMAAFFSAPHSLSPPCPRRPLPPPVSPFPAFRAVCTSMRKKAGPRPCLFPWEIGDLGEKKERKVEKKHISLHRAECGGAPSFVIFTISRKYPLVKLKLFA